MHQINKNGQQVYLYTKPDYKARSIFPLYLFNHYSPEKTWCIFAFNTLNYSNNYTRKDTKVVCQVQIKLVTLFKIFHEIIPKNSKKKPDHIHCTRNTITIPIFILEYAYLPLFVFTDTIVYKYQLLKLNISTKESIENHVKNNTKLENLDEIHLHIKKLICHSYTLVKTNQTK